MEHVIEQALLNSDQYGILVQGRLRFKKRRQGKQLRDAGISLREESSREMLECIVKFNLFFLSYLNCRPEFLKLFVPRNPLNS